MILFRPSLAHQLGREEDGDYWEEPMLSGEIGVEQVARMRICSWLAGMKDSRQQGAFKLNMGRDDPKQKTHNDCKC